MIFRASITDGWNGKELDGCDYPTWDNAIEFIKRTAPKHSRHVQEVWSFNTMPADKPDCITHIIDFGSHQFFARIVETGKPWES